MTIRAFALIALALAPGLAGAADPRGPVVFKSAAEWSAQLAEKAKAAPADLVSTPVKDGDKYHISVVRRTKPQGAIAHTAGTEIHSVIDGAATFVTDGTIVRTPAGAERGPGSIQNGTSRRVSAGDITVVPPQTPHWYPSIDGVVTYLEIRFDVGAPNGAPSAFLSQAESRATLAGKAAATPAPLLFDAPVARAEKYQANVVKRTKAQGGAAHETGSEVHQILEGTGTLVTGGTLVRPAAGSGGVATITGGESRRVQKGDVVLIPAGTPHWYKEIDGTITYLEVRFELPVP